MFDLLGSDRVPENLRSYHGINDLPGSAWPFARQAQASRRLVQAGTYLPLRAVTQRQNDLGQSVRGSPFVRATPGFYVAGSSGLVAKRRQWMPLSS